MTFAEAKQALNEAIADWHAALPGTRLRPWRAIQDAILALDNAAYDRAFQLAGAGEYVRTMRRDLEDERAHREHVEAERDGFRGELEELHRRTSAEIELLKQAATYRYGNNVRLRNEIEHRMRDHDELQRQFDERGRERDRLVRELELVEERWETEADQADQILKERDLARADTTTMTLANDDKRQEIERLQAELADAREKVQSQSMCLARVNEAHARTYSRESRVAERWQTEASRLRKALETLADRYHFELCFDTDHTRQECSDPPDAVKDAEKALAGESGNDVARLIGRLSAHQEGVRKTLFAEADRMIFDDREPQDPDIEAVLIGSTELACADGCGRVVKQGNVMYRPTKQVTDQPLYATVNCAKEALEWKRWHRRQRLVYKCRGTDGCGSTWRAAMLDGGRCPKCHQGAPGLQLVDAMDQP